MKKQQSVRFDTTMNRWIKKQAEKQRRSVAEIIRMIVEDAIKNDWRGDRIYQIGGKLLKKMQSVRFETTTDKWLKKQAEKHRRSVSEIIRMIISDAMNNNWGE